MTLILTHKNSNQISSESPLILGVGNNFIEITFFIYSELKTENLRSSGPGHGYWAHLRRGEADIGSALFVFGGTHLHTPTHTTHPDSYHTFTFDPKRHLILTRTTKKRHNK